MRCSRSSKRLPSPWRGRALTLVDVTGARVRPSTSSGSPNASTTEFQKQHAAFLKFITAFPSKRGPRVVRLGDAEPADVRLLHPAQGLPRRRPRLPAQPAEPHASGSTARTSSTPSTATFCCASSTKGLAGRKRDAGAGEAARAHSVPEWWPLRRPRTRKARPLRQGYPDSRRGLRAIFDYFDQ